jgi:hypothetical protein
VIYSGLKSRSIFYKMKGMSFEPLRVRCERNVVFMPWLSIHDTITRMLDASRAFSAVGLFGVFKCPPMHEGPQDLRSLCRCEFVAFNQHGLSPFVMVVNDALSF